METISFVKSGSLLTASQWLHRVGNLTYHSGAGGVPCFTPPTRIGHYLECLATVIADDGSFNGESQHAERTALCLKENENDEEAYRLFQAIVKDASQVLFVHEQPSPYPSKAVADTPNLLGYEGIYQFGALALARGEKKLAEKLFLELVEKTPTTCCPIRLQDIRVESLKSLRELGVKTLTSGRLVVDELVAAKDHQY